MHLQSLGNYYIHTTANDINTIITLLEMGVIENESVLKTFFSQYEPTIKRTGQTLYTENLPLTAVTHWSSVAEFYGFLLAVKENDSKDLILKKKLQTSYNIQKFNEHLLQLPTTVIKAIYTLFRSGAGHQIFPKASGVGFYTHTDNLFFIHNDPQPNLPVLNARIYSNLVWGGYQKLKQEVLDSSPFGKKFTQNVYYGLLYDKAGDIPNHDPLGDYEELKAHWPALFPEIPYPHNN